MNKTAIITIAALLIFSVAAIAFNSSAQIDNAKYSKAGMNANNNPYVE